MEDQGEGNAYHQRKGSEDEPAGLPFTYQETVLPVTETVDDLTSGQRTDSGTQTVGHHHEQALGRSLDAGFAFLIDIDTTRNIEEVEGNTIDDAGKDKEEYTRHGRIADAEEAEAEYPGKERHKHHNLNTETLQEERYHQDAACLTDLRDTR